MNRIVGAEALKRQLCHYTVVIIIIIDMILKNILVVSFADDVP